MSFVHHTVLLQETVDAIAPIPGGVYADLTLGGGGHAEAILERSAPDGRLYGVDRDTRALDAARERLSAYAARTTFVHGSFGGFAERAGAEGWGPFDGLVADVGVSSPQLDDGSRGFSFRFDGPLDMRMDDSAGMSAKELIASLDEGALADLIYEYGEERRSRPIARSIKRAEGEQKLETTGDLAHAVRRVFGRSKGKSRIDPATRTFQALRIAVNDELGQLRQLVEQAPAILKEGGRLAIISFHSLEDRIVKWAFRNDPRWSPLTKKPITAGDEELGLNPRSRTAKLRAASHVSEETSA